VLTFVHEIPETKKAIPRKLILQRKLNPVGETVRYKARLVALGFRQVWRLGFYGYFCAGSESVECSCCVVDCTRKGFCSTSNGCGYGIPRQRAA